MSAREGPSATTGTGTETAPKALTLACNKCNTPIFRDNELSIAECCGELFCEHCWDQIERTLSPCLCGNTKPPKGRIYFMEDCDDQASKDRDINRQVALEGNPLWLGLKEDTDVLKARTMRQRQQISDKEHIQATLDNQIQQAAGRVEALNQEASSLLTLVQENQNRREEVLASNAVLAERIQFLKRQTEAIEGMSDRIAGTSG